MLSDLIYTVQTRGEECRHAHRGFKLALDRGDWVLEALAERGVGQGHEHLQAVR